MLFWLCAEWQPQFTCLFPGGPPGWHYSFQSLFACLSGRCFRTSLGAAREARGGPRSAAPGGTAARPAGKVRTAGRGWRARRGQRGGEGRGRRPRHLIKRLRVSREQRAHSAVGSCSRGGAARQRTRLVLIPGVGPDAVARGDLGCRSSCSLEPGPERKPAAAPRSSPLPSRCAGPPMAAAGQLWLLYLSAWLLARLGAAFNLDTREDNVIRKTGDPGSLFGFSLAMHWQLQPEEKRL